MAQKTKYNEKYWRDQLSRSTEAHRDFDDRSEESINVYSRRMRLSDVKRELGVWWYLVETILPTYCSRIPKVEIALRKKSGSVVDQLASLGLERATQYSLDENFDFMNAVISAAKSYLLTGRGVLWTRYDAQLREKAFEYKVFPAEDGTILDVNGNPIDTKAVEVEQEEDGSYIAHEKVKAKDDERVILESLFYRDFRVPMCRSLDEIEWKARRAYLDEEKVREMFGAKVANQVKYDVLPEDVKRNSRPRNGYEPEGKSEWFEIWCKKSGKVYWLNERGTDTVLESDDPPLDFKDFFPCVEITANLDTSTVIPVSDYWHARDTILEVERMTTRIHACIEAARVTGVYDATIGDDIEAILSGDFLLRPIKRWPSYKAKGGLSAMIEMFDPSPYVTALTTLVEQRERALNNLYEQFKCGDIVRGVTDAQETAAAQELKSGWASFGAKVRQGQFTKFVSDAIAKCATVIATEFDEPHIAKMADADELMTMAAQDPMAQGVQWQQVVESMKAGIEGYRIKVSSDSLVEMNEQRERAEKAELMNATGALLQQSLGMMQQFPAITPYIMDMMRMVNRSYRFGKELESTLDGSVATISQQIEAAAQQPQETPPDPAVVTAQADMQIAQIQAQTKQQEMQLEAQLKAQDAAMLNAKNQVELEIKREEVELKKQEMMLDYEKLKTEQARIEAEIQIANTKVKLETEKAQGDIDHKALKLEYDANVSRLQAVQDQQKLAIEQYRVKLDEYEKLLEERRLSEQKDLEERKLAESKKLPPIHINVDANKPTRSKKRGKVIRDAEGNLQGIEYEDGE